MDMITVVMNHEHSDEHDHGDENELSDEHDNGDESELSDELMSMITVTRASLAMSMIQR